jgi:DNA gyrase subunit A
MGKRTLIEEFHVQHRSGKGLKCYKITDRTGSVIGAKAVNEDDEIMMITNEGIVMRTGCSSISVLKRITSGVKLMDVKYEEGIKVANIAKVSEEVRNDQDMEEKSDEETTEE